MRKKLNLEKRLQKAFNKKARMENVLFEFADKSWYYTGSVKFFPKPTYEETMKYFTIHTKLINKKYRKLEEVYNTGTQSSSYSALVELIKIRKQSRVVYNHFKFINFEIKVITSLLNKEK
jgi:hypothetical protein